MPNESQHTTSSSHYFSAHAQVFPRGKIIPLYIYVPLSSLHLSLSYVCELLSFLPNFFLSLLFFYPIVIQSPFLPPSPLLSDSSLPYHSTSPAERWAVRLGCVISTFFRSPTRAYVHEHSLWKAVLFRGVW
jgi:hypothetical protein